MSDAYAEIDCEFEHDTDAAFLLDVGLDESVWVPKSVCNNLNNLDANNYSGVMEIKEWWALKNELI